MTGPWHVRAPTRSWSPTGLLAPVTRRSTWSGLIYLLFSAPMAVLWLLLVGAGLLIGGATAVLGVGLPVLLGSLLFTRQVAELDRRLLNSMSAARVEPPQPHEVVGDGGLRAAAWALLQSSRTWRSFGWVLFRAVAAALVMAGAVVAAVVLAALLALPWIDGYLVWGTSWRSTSGWASAWTLPIGLLGLLASLHLSRLLVTVHVRVAQVLLSPDPSARVAELTAQAQRAQERARLARDLHDSIGHAMTLIVVQAGAAGTALDRDPSFVRAALLDIANAARTALDELDLALEALRDDPAGQRTADTLEDIPQMLARAAAAGLTVDLDLSEDLHHVPIKISRAAYRIVQEACTNVLRHGGVLQTAAVSVSTASDQLRIRISNPLQGPPARPRSAGRGLKGAAARVHELGGTLTAGPTNSEWLLAVTLPLTSPHSRPDASKHP